MSVEVSSVSLLTQGKLSVTMSTTSRNTPFSFKNLLNTMMVAYKVAQMPKNLLFWQKDDNDSTPQTTRRSNFERVLNSNPDILTLLLNQKETTKSVSCAVAKREILRIMEIRKQERQGELPSTVARLARYAPNDMIKDDYTEEECERDLSSLCDSIDKICKKIDEMQNANLHRSQQSDVTTRQIISSSLQRGRGWTAQHFSSDDEDEVDNDDQVLQPPPTRQRRASVLNPMQENMVLFMQAVVRRLDRMDDGNNEPDGAQ